MIKKIFTLLDSKAEMYLPPFVANTKAAAIREMQNVMRNPQTPMSMNKEDFSLWDLGTYNDNTGEIISHNNGIECVAHLVNIDPEKEIQESQEN